MVSTSCMKLHLGQTKEGESEYKFEWQKTSPRGKYAKDVMARKLLGPSMHPSELMAEMRNSGFALKKCVLGRNSSVCDPSQEYVVNEEEEDPEVEFLKSLTTKQKEKLLRKLEGLQKKSEGP